MLFDFSIIQSWPNMRASVKPDLVAIIEDHWFGSPFGVVSRVKLTSGEIYLSNEKQTDLRKRLDDILEDQR